MKLLVIALLSLAITKLVLGQQEVEPSEPLQDITINDDFLIRLLFNISEARIPNYLIGVIFNRPTEKGISSDAVLNLYQADNISLATVQTILQLLNISQTQVFSINGLNYTLETFNWTFTNFYNTLVNKLNLAGDPLRQGLEALQIDVTAFSMGIAMGSPDPWQEFIKGNFTQANLELACTRAGITLEILWQGVRDIFINNLITYEIEDFVQLLLNHNIREEHALIIWNEVPITVDHVYSLQLFNDIIRDFFNRINNQTALGVLTSSQEVVVHRTIYEAFREERDLLDIQAQTLLTRTALSVGTINDTIYRNLVVLRHSEAAPLNNLTTINIEFQNSNLTNCSYVTFQNNNILTANVPSAIFNNETYEIPRSIVQNVISGSALVCDNSVYGLARGVEGDVIIADAFSIYVAPPDSSAECLSAAFLKIIGVFIVLKIKVLIF